jgi:predicted transcriptional regulator
MTELSIYEKEILRLLRVARRALTTTQVAEKTGISWETAKKYLDKLHGRRYIRKHDAGNRIYWRAYRKGEKT